MRTAWLLIVMPRSRSMSMRSRYCARMARASTTPVSWSMRSASVDLPWSMCAMMQKLRIRSGGVALGANAERAMGDTWDEPRRVRVTGMVLVGGRAALESPIARARRHSPHSLPCFGRPSLTPPGVSAATLTHNGGHARPTDAGPARGPGSHLPLRRYVRHPREILTLVVADPRLAAAARSRSSEVSLAFDEQRTPDVYALALIFAPLLVWFARGQLWAQQRLTGIKLTPEQFPEAYAMLIDAAGRSGLSYVPDAYVVLGNGVINAARPATASAGSSSSTATCSRSAARRASPTRSASSSPTRSGTSRRGTSATGASSAPSPRSGSPLVGSTLSRAQEYTADNYGHALAPQGARSAMATLAGGKYLGRSVDVDAMADRAVTEPGFFVWVTNAVASHPALLWRMHALRDRRAPDVCSGAREPWLWGRPAAPGAYALPARVGFEPTPLPGTPPRSAGTTRTRSCTESARSRPWRAGRRRRERPARPRATAPRAPEQPAGRRRSRSAWMRQSSTGWLARRW